MMRLVQLRIDAGLSRGQLAERAGLTIQGLANIENGVTSNPQVATLHKLAAQLGEGVRPSELLMDAIPPMHKDEPKAAA